MQLAVVTLWITTFALGARAGQARPPGDWNSVSGLAPGSEVRVLLSDGRTLRGSLDAATSDSLTINLATGQEAHQREDVRRVQLKRPGRRGRNTLIGFAVGAGTGLAFGSALDSRSGDTWFPNLGKAVCTPFGAVVGTVVGLVWPSRGWRDVYRAP